MHLWSLRQRWQYGARQCAGLGFLAAGLELVGLAASLRLALGFTGFLLLGLGALLLMGIAGTILGGLVGIVIHRPLEESDASLAVAIQMAAAATLLCGGYLWLATADLLSQGRVPAAAVMAVMPLPFGLVAFFNCRYWLRRFELTDEARVGWNPAALAVGLLLLFGTATAHSLRDPGGQGALAGDPNALVVTIDGLRADRVAGEDPIATAIATVGAQGIVFEQAVSPASEPVAVGAAVATALHPLRHRVLQRGDLLAGGFLTLAEVLDAEGYATAAFVSNGALGTRSGLAQGYRTYDDDVSALFLGLDRLVWVRAVRDALGSSDAARHRSSRQTGLLAQGWVADNSGVPFLLWVHLDAPVHATDAESYDEAVRSVDADVAGLLDALDTAGIADETLVIVAGSHGWMLGEHGIDEGRQGLYDELVHVPLVMRAPGIEVTEPRVTAQVRLVDIAPTVLSYLRLDPLEEIEGVELLGYATGERTATMWCSLVGRSGDDLFDHTLVGVRSNGIKYIREVRTGRELLFAVGDDPGETDELSVSQPTTLEKARELLAPEEAALRRVLLDR